MHEKAEPPHPLHLRATFKAKNTIGFLCLRAETKLRAFLPSKGGLVLPGDPIWIFGLFADLPEASALEQRDFWLP